MKKILGVAGALALALTGHASAQDAGTDEQGVTKLDRILITTPLRRESPLERSTSSVTVIDEESIKQSAASDLPSFLKTYAGVTVTSNGGMGADSGVSLRGTTAAQTLVLVNGVRAGSATVGTPNLSSIPLASIERIEIAKGGHSAQYGADAIGGIINIITKQGGLCADGRSQCATATVGVTHPWGGYVSGNVQGQSEGGVNYAAGAQLLGTRGYDFTLPTAYGHEPDDDGFLQGTANLSLSKDFDWGRVYADGLYAHGRNQFDRFPDNQADTVNFSGRIGTRFDHSDTWSSTVELMSALDNTSNFGPGGAGDDFDTSRYGILASTQKSFETGDVKHVILGGVEAYRESVSGSSVYGVDYAKTKRDLTAIFGQYSFEYAALTVDSGLRYDHNEQFGGATTYNIGASYELTSGLVARASYATGFRAPTFNDLYYPDMYTPGNPNLKPEKSESFEIGVNWQVSEQTSLDLAFYQTKVSDQINWAPDSPGSFIWTPTNIERVKITGFEAALAHRFNAEWSGKASADVRQPLNQSPNATGKYIPYGDRFKATTELTYSPTEQIDLTARVIYGSARYIYSFNAKLPDYVTADFIANYALDDHSQFKFSVANIFDEQYETKENYRSPGRTFDLSFTRSF